MAIGDWAWESLKEHTTFIMSLLIIVVFFVRTFKWIENWCAPAKTPRRKLLFGLGVSSTLVSAHIEQCVFGLYSWPEQDSLGKRVCSFRNSPGPTATIA